MLLELVLLVIPTYPPLLHISDDRDFYIRKIDIYQCQNDLHNVS